MSSVKELVSAQRPHVLCLQETKHSEKTRCVLPGYKCFKSERATHHLGLITYVLATLACVALPLPVSSCEALCLQLTTKKGPISVINCYCSPSRGLVGDLFPPEPPIEDTIWIGDFNSRHIELGDTINTPSGRALVHSINRLGAASAVPDAPTRVGPRGEATCLDLAVLVGPNNFAISVCDFDKSDHLPIALTISSELVTVPPRKGWNLGKADWKEFRRELDARLELGPIGESRGDIEKAASLLTNAILTAAEHSVPKHGAVQSQCSAPSDKLTSLRSARNKARRDWQRSRTHSAHLAYREACSRVHTEWLEIEDRRWAEAINSQEDYSRKFWRITRSLRRGAAEEIPPLRTPAGMAVTDEAKAEALADVVTVPLGVSDQGFYEHVEAQARGWTRARETCPSEYFTTPRKLIKIIKTFKLNKAPGADGILAIFLRNLSRKALAFLASLINACLSRQVIPASWKFSLVVCIYKKGKDRSDPASYRPISLLPLLSKVFEKVLKIQIDAFLTRAGVIPDFQHGFTGGKGTATQLKRVDNIICSGLEWNKSSTLVAFDLSKAFDTMWHAGLIFKLKSFNAPLVLILLIAEYLAGRTFQTTLNGVKSLIREILCGIPQGSVLGPILFNIFLADMPTPPNSLISGYADDTTLVCQSANSTMANNYATRAAAMLKAYFNKWMLIVNQNKTQTLSIVQRKRVPKKQRPVFLDGVELRPAKTLTLLGLQLTSRHNFLSTINNRRSAANKAFYQLYALSSPKSYLSVKNKILLYTSILRPIMSYGVEVWFDYCSQIKWKKFQHFQNKVIKAALGRSVRSSTTEMRRLAPLISFKEFCKNKKINFVQKCNASPHPDISILHNKKHKNAHCPLTHS